MLWHWEINWSEIFTTRLDESWTCHFQLVLTKAFRNVFWTHQIKLLQVYLIDWFWILSNRWSLPEIRVYFTSRMTYNSDRWSFISHNNIHFWLVRIFSLSGGINQKYFWWQLFMDSCVLWLEKSKTSYMIKGAGFLAINMLLS